jgi:hypothetical protein
MTPQSHSKRDRRDRLRLLRPFDPDGSRRVRSSRSIRGNLLLKRGAGGMKSIQSQAEFAGEDRFDFLPQTGLCGERFSLTEIQPCEPQTLVLYSTSNHDYHHFFAGLLTVLTAAAGLLKRQGFRHQE